MGCCSNFQGQNIDSLKDAGSSSLKSSPDDLNIEIEDLGKFGGKDHNEWNFEDDGEFKINQKDELNFECDIGALLYVKNFVIIDDFQTIEVPYNLFNSKQIGIKKYFLTIDNKEGFKWKSKERDWKENKKLFNFQLGLGTTFHHLNLGKNEANILDDTIIFFKSSKEIRKNFIRYHYLTVPLKLNFKPLPSKKKTFQIGASVQYHLLLNGKYELKFQEQNSSKKISTLGKLHHQNHFISSRIQLSCKKIGVYVENGITSISTIFQSPYSLSFGIVLCSYK